MDYGIVESTVKKYTRRFKKTGSILSEFEINSEKKKKMKKKLRRRIIDNYAINDFLMGICDIYPTKSLSSYVDNRSRLDGQMEIDGNIWRDLDR